MFQRGDEMTKKTLFFKAKHPTLAKLISLKSVGMAKESVKLLKHKFNQEKTHVAKLRLFRATQAAANRAEVISKNPRVSWDVQHSFVGIENVYREAAMNFDKHLGKKRR